MRLGLIARADSRGLGIQTLEVYRHLSPAKTMVVDCPSANPLPLRPDWYPDATWVRGLPTAEDFRRWLDGVDVVYTAETGYSPALWSESERAGVRTVLHFNREFLDTRDRPTLWAAPSMWRFDEAPDPKVFLPVPVAGDRFAGMQRDVKPTATNFLHVVGRPAIHDRNGTADLLAALRYVRSPITVTIRCQDPAYVPSLLHTRSIPAHIELVIVSADIPNYWDAYRGADVLVMPRRFGGLCLPVNEALGAGMPIVMPDISPNNLWLPRDWLVPAEMRGEFMAKTHVGLYSADHRALAAKIDRLATDRAFYAEAETIARDLAKRNSWEALLPEYRRVLAGPGPRAPL